MATVTKATVTRALVRSYSDHRLVLATRYTKNIISSPRYVKKRAYKNFDENMFVQEVRNTSLLEVYLSNDANEAAELLAKKLNAILDVMAPVKKIQLRSNFAPWISQDCKAEMAARDAANKSAVESGLNSDWDTFWQVRNSVTRRVRKEKEAWRRGKMEGCQANSSSCWKNVMGWLGWGSSGSPTKLYSGAKVETSPQRMANIMNHYYVNKVAEIQAALPPPSEEPLARLRAVMAGRVVPEFNLQPVHPEVVDKIVRNLKNSKASGLDYIDTNIIKLVRN